MWPRNSGDFSNQKDVVTKFLWNFTSNQDDLLELVSLSSINVFLVTCLIPSFSVVLLPATKISFLVHFVASVHY